MYGTVGTFRHSGARRRLKPTLNKVRQMFDLFLQPDDLDTRLTGGGDWLAKEPSSALNRERLASTLPSSLTSHHSGYYRK